MAVITLVNIYMYLMMYLMNKFINFYKYKMCFVKNIINTIHTIKMKLIKPSEIDCKAAFMKIDLDKNGTLDK